MWMYDFHFFSERDLKLLQTRYPQWRKKKIQGALDRKAHPMDKIPDIDTLFRVQTITNVTKVHVEQHVQDMHNTDERKQNWIK